MRNADNGVSPVVLDPHGAVSTPQRARGRARYAASLVFATAAIGAIACQSSNDASGAIPPVVVGMTQNAAPYYSSANLTIYWEQTPVALPVRAGAGTEANVSPYPAAPYLLDTDYQLEINYTLTNLDNTSHAVWITLNPWNQFVRYYPGITVVSNDETEPNLPGTERAIVLDPMAKVQGTFTPDDMTDLATKLAIAMAIMVKPLPASSMYSQATLLNHDFDVQYRTNDGDPLMKPFIPSIIAGLTGFDLGIQTYETMNVALEIDMQLVDNSGGPGAPNGKFIAPGQSGTPVGMPPQILKVPGAM